MKKILALVLVLLLSVSLASCGDTSQKMDRSTSQQVDKNDVASYLGTWTAKNMEFTFHSNMHGRYDWDNIWVEFTYEINNGAVSLLTESRSGNERAVLKLNDDGTTLTLIQNGLEHYEEGETEFKKNDR